MRELWTKKPTYEEVLQQLEKDYKIKLPNRVALEFYDSFAMSKFREQQQMITTHGAAADEQRDGAMGQAAAESGIGNQGLLSFGAADASTEPERQRAVEKGHARHGGQT